ncbi:MAG: RidA family protein [Myxococcales bacterium FL481]|nr:MAG: RidA family protein [Myxococcales bacterium FL481]
MRREKVSSPSPWEHQYAYCRARRVGPMVFVAGTVAVDESGQVVGAGDVAEQARFIFRKIAAALRQCDAELADVVRTRMYLRDISQLDAVGAVHAEVFRDIVPVATGVEVSGLAGEGVDIEIEVDAVVSADPVFG